jgi:protein TonB
MATEGITASRMTANDRFKNGFGSWFWGSIAAAALLHFVMFMFWPDATAADVAFDNIELEAIDLPPEIEIPPPPEQIARPATPVISDVTIDEDITIAPTTFEMNPIENLPPPPSPGEGDISDAPVYTPFEVAPELKNRTAITRALERYYPPMLKDAGIGGSPEVWFYINQSGRVEKTLLNKSSGQKQLDEAALKVADIMEFSPALNRDQKVSVWVSLPITFRVTN